MRFALLTMTVFGLFGANVAHAAINNSGNALSSPFSSPRDRITLMVRRQKLVRIDEKNVGGDSIKLPVTDETLYFSVIEPTERRVSFLESGQVRTYISGITDVLEKTGTTHTTASVNTLFTGYGCSYIASRVSGGGVKITIYAETSKLTKMPTTTTPNGPIQRPEWTSTYFTQSTTLEPGQGDTMHVPLGSDEEAEIILSREES